MHAGEHSSLQDDPALTGRWRTHAWGALALVIGIYSLGWLSGFERLIKDADALLMRHAVQTDVVLVDIDAKSLRLLNTWPWPRRYHAQLLDQLRSADPALVAFDIDFSSESNPVEDQAFSRALSAWDKDQVALAAFLQYADSSKQSIFANYPIEILRKYAVTASINLFPAGDGLVRGVSLRNTDHPPNAPPLVTFLYGKHAVPDDLFIDYAIDPRSILHYSYADVMQGRFDPVLLKGKKIIVGATAIELRDQVAVPVYKVLPGPVVQAMAYESLRSGALVRPSAAIRFSLLLVFGVTMIALMRRYPTFPKLWGMLTMLVIIYCAALGLRGMTQYQLDAFPYMLLMAAVYLVRQIAHFDGQVMSGLAQKLLLTRKQYHIDTINTHTLEGMVSIDKADRITSANPAAGSIFAASLGNIVGSSLSTFFPGLCFEQGVAKLQGINIPGNRFEIVGSRGDGERFYADISIERSDRNTREDDMGSMLFVRDISPLKLQQELLDFQADHDPLTRLLNRSGFVTKIDADISSYSEAQRTLLVIGVRSMLDVNHELGHAAGESLLMAVSSLLTRVSARQEDALLIARLATDEFGIWIKGDIEVAGLLADAIAQQVAAPLLIEGVQVDVGLAIGIALYPEHADVAENMLRCASVAMNAVAGTTTAAQIFNEDISTIAMHKLTMASQLREAIGSNGLMVYYQPKLDIRSELVTSVEALARWKHPELGFISPEVFIRVAEETGVIKSLTAWVFNTVVKQHASWLRRGIDLRIAVNISSKLLVGDELLDVLDEASTDNPSLPSAITLEITESAIMDNRQDAVALLNSLSSRGYRMSLDDFGAGHSSFAYLKDLPVQELKIDKSFVMNLENSPKDAQIVSSIIALAHGLGLEVVAEGIETQAVLNLLASQGCEYGQGYWIGKPMPATDVATRFFAGEHKIRSAL